MVGMARRYKARFLMLSSVSQRRSRNTESLQRCVSEGTNKLTVSLLTYFSQMSLLCGSATSGELCTWQLLRGSRLNCSPAQL